MCLRTNWYLYYQTILLPLARCCLMTLNAWQAIIIFLCCLLSRSWIKILFNVLNIVCSAIELVVTACMFNHWTRFWSLNMFSVLKIIRWFFYLPFKAPSKANNKSIFFVCVFGIEINLWFKHCYLCEVYVLFFLVFCV